MFTPITFPNTSMKFWLHCLLITIFTYVVLIALYGVLQLNAFNAFDPIGQAIGQMELSDIAFSRFREGEPTPDENVTIVNIGNLSRGEIGDQIRSIVHFKPRVIALDIIFSCEIRDSVNCPQAFDVMGNLSFYSAIAQAEAQGVKVVMAEKLHQSNALIEQYGDTDQYDSIEHTDEMLLGNSYEGFVNLITDATHQEDIKHCREINPMIMVNGKPELAFSVMTAKMFDEEKARKFLERENFTEVINYRGNTPDPYGASTYSGRYQFLDVHQALDTSSFSGDMIRDKVVIFGFHGENQFDRSWEDKFFTPLNREYAGRSRPDMYGVVVHANAVSMILQEDYINLVPQWLSFLVSFLVVFFTAALFLKIEMTIPVWYDLLSLLIQLALFVLFSLLMILVFSYYSIQLDFTVTLAAVALAGTAFELYFGGILRLYEYLSGKFSTEKPEKEQ